MSLKIAIAQINATVGDLAGNAARILDFAERARAQGADLLLTPELALCGYPPEDLLLRPDFYAACERELDALAAKLHGIAVLVGHPQEKDGRRYNAATLIDNGYRVVTYYKHRLPNYEVFDEERYFDSGDVASVVTLKGVRVGINICADVWEAGAADMALAAGAEVLLVLNASPYHLGKQKQRTDVLRERVATTGLPVIYANLVGGQDELVFDGASFALDSTGVLRCQLPLFEEALAVLEVAGGEIRYGTIAPAQSSEAEVYQALVLGVRDYLGKNGFPGAIIGLSGGIDSALTLCIAVDALGADKVRAVMMPSPYTADISLDDSREMVRLLGVRYDEIAIEPAMNTFASLLEKERLSGSDHRQQVGDGGWLLHALRRHGRWFCRDQGHRQDAGLSPVTLAQHGFAGDPRAHHHAASFGRVEAGADRSGQLAALRGARRDCRGLHGA
jgi:NAD+ synthase/NAD+ synthase (glutamine-hydrolysing)